MGIRNYKHAIEALPFWGYKAFRHGALPTGWRAVTTLHSEGWEKLHWKILGDGLVHFFSEAGPVFTKLGQILSTRADLLPDVVCERLQALYTEQTPMTPEELKSILKKAYGRKRPFKNLDKAPIAVGSIGAVYRAQLRDGQEVVVKVLRPGVKRMIRRDMDAIRLYLRAWKTLCRRDPGLYYVLDRILQDLAEGFEQETNLKQEARAILDFRKSLKRHPKVYVPHLHQRWCTETTLVMEELKGVPLSDFREQAKSEPEKAKQLADLALKEILRQIFDQGRFHGDPHSGNFIVLGDGRLGIIDLGLTGEFGPADRKKLVMAIKAFVARDPDKVIQSLLKFGELPPEFDKDQFKAEIVAVVRRHKETVADQAKGESTEEANKIAEFVNELFAVAYRHRIHVPASTTIFIKTLVTIEGVARTLDPELNLVKSALPLILRSTLPRWLRW